MCLYIVDLWLWRLPERRSLSFPSLLEQIILQSLKGSGVVIYLKGETREIQLSVPWLRSSRNSPAKGTDLHLLHSFFLFFPSCRLHYPALNISPRQG